MTVEAYTPKVNWINTTLSSKGLSVDFENAKVLELWGNAGTLLKDPENEVAELVATEYFDWVNFENFFRKS